MRFRGVLGRLALRFVACGSGRGDRVIMQCESGVILVLSVTLIANRERALLEGNANEDPTALQPCRDPIDKGKRILTSLTVSSHKTRNPSNTKREFTTGSTNAREVIALQLDHAVHG
jgi:hypothetical protein